MAIGLSTSGTLFGFVAPPPPGAVRRVAAAGPLLGAAQVSGFEAPGELDVVAGLPEGLLVDAGILGLVAAVRRLDVWLDTGRRVQTWADDNGLEGQPWCDTAGVIGVPPLGEGVDIPAFVTAWVADADEIAGIVEVLVS